MKNTRLIKELEGNSKVNIITLSSDYVIYENLTYSQDSSYYNQFRYYRQGLKSGYVSKSNNLIDLQ